MSAGLQRPTVDDWTRVNRQVPRLVDALPNGPRMHPTVQVFLAGGVPEVMLHLRRAGLLETGALTVSGETLGDMLDWWEQSERRAELRRVLQERDGIDPDDVIMDPDGARRRGLTSTVTFPNGNLAPGGSVIKSTSIDPSVVDADGVYRKTRSGARVPHREGGHRGDQERRHRGGRRAGADVPRADGLGHGRDLPDHLRAEATWHFGKHVAVITDARFSGVSTGACIGHVTPEALAGGPIGKVREGDTIEIVIDRVKLEGSVNLVVNGDASKKARACWRRARCAKISRRTRGLPRRDAAVGGAAGCQRRHLGRLRVRRGSDRAAAAGRRLGSPLPDQKMVCQREF